MTEAGQVDWFYSSKCSIITPVNPHIKAVALLVAAHGTTKPVRRLRMSDHTTHDSNNTIKYCECGCGEPAPIAKRTDKRHGHVKGQPTRFVNRHAARLQEVRPIEDRFWEKVDKRGPDECWLWQGGTCRGYGLLGIDSKMVKAHRFSYELHNGPIEDGLHCLHKCDRRACVNPAHLFLGTQADNLQDMVDKGRQARGERHGNSKLTPQEVRRIRALSQTGMSQRKIASRFGVHQNTISGIVTGKRWGHVK